MIREDHGNGMNEKKTVFIFGPPAAHGTSVSLVCLRCKKKRPMICSVRVSSNFVGPIDLNVGNDDGSMRPCGPSSAWGLFRRAMTASASTNAEESKGELFEASVHLAPMVHRASEPSARGRCVFAYCCCLYLEVGPRDGGHGVWTFVLFLVLFLQTLLLPYPRTLLGLEGDVDLVPHALSDGVHSCPLADLCANRVRVERPRVQGSGVGFVTAGSS